MANNDGKKTDPTSYDLVKEFSEILEQRLGSGGVPFGLQNFPLYIELGFKDNAQELGRLMATPDCDKLLAVFGIDNHNRFTVSFAALKGTDIHPDHLNGSLPCEETWPNASITFFDRNDPPDQNPRTNLP